MNRMIKLTIGMTGLLLATATWAATHAGNIILVSGAVSVRDVAGIEHPASVGMAVDAGDTLVTGNGRTQVRFTDGGFISLQSDTQFRVQEFKFQDASKDGDSAIFNLIKGGFRTITGLVGKKRRSDYRVETATSTIGIRGTEYQAMLCLSSCKEPDGLYVQTGEGTIFLKNAAGEIDVGKGEKAYVASANTAPQKTTTTPPLTARSTGTSPAPENLPGIGTTDFQPGNILGANSLGPITPLTGGGLALAAAGTLSGTASSNFPGFSSFSGSGSGSGSGADSLENIPAGTIVGAYMNGGAVNGFVVSSGGGIGSVVAGSPPVNVGSNGDLYWGRWTGTTINLYAGLGGYFASASLTLPATSSIFYLLGTSTPTVPGTGTATFNFVGGSPSADQAGVIGSGITSGSLTANFAANNVTGGFVVNQAGNIYTVSSLILPMGSSNRASFGSERGAGGTGTVTGPGSPFNVAQSGGSQVNGFFVGSGAPSGAGISYMIKLPGNGIVGVGAFR